MGKTKKNRKVPAPPHHNVTLLLAKSISVLFVFGLAAQKFNMPGFVCCMLCVFWPESSKASSPSPESHPLSLQICASLFVCVCVYSQKKVNSTVLHLTYDNDN